MPFTLNTVEALAPDQASLTAAVKLAKVAKWARLERDGMLLWGECQGSGANPYRVIADAGSQGSKCTCPSRKFPCKHSLALMWLDAASPGAFLATSPPAWVADWLGRRRKTGTEAAPATHGGGKSIEAAALPGAEPAPEDPKAAAKREAAQKKRAGNTHAAITEALEELEQWIADQLRLGLGAFVDNAPERCRRIAARMVDLKSAALASRIDEMPARLLALRSEERPEAAIRELGKLTLMLKAWRANPDEPEIRRQIATAETREQIVNDPAAPIVEGVWEVAGEKIQTRRDGLVSHATWLMSLEPRSQRFAQLLDFYPASGGKRAEAFAQGEQFAATLVFYPSPAPLRAIVLQRAPAPAQLPWPPVAASPDPLACCAPFWNGTPWGLECPLTLPPGCIVKDNRGHCWWRADEQADATGLPLSQDAPLPVLGMALAGAVGLWSGARLELLAAWSDFGRLDLS
ncbi:MAG: SWIM zinc finger family protein [Azoarcus sp.]|jgi:uncharacterized Zn finger protein|nr:SWIM zinc finger family protein [Azoarcus sp.]